MSTSMALHELALVLFTCRLQASEHPSAQQVRTAIDEQLCACGGDCAKCAALVAQEAGDHPDEYVIRMRWAIDTVKHVYPDPPVAA